MHIFLLLIEILHKITSLNNLVVVMVYKTSQELRMLSSVAINCQITKIVMNPGSQLSELKSVSQMSQVLGLSKNMKIIQKSENLPKI